MEKQLKYQNNYVLLWIIALLFVGCSNSEDNENLIDYDKLNELEVHLAMDIGEVDNYIPGRMRDLVLNPDGTLLVSDLGNITIEQFNAEGEHVATIAQEGRGPGELSNFFDLIGKGNDTLIVRHQGMSNQVDFFSRGANNIFKLLESRMQQENKERSISIIGSRSENQYYATANTIYQSFEDGADNFNDYNQAPLVVIDESESILKDSVLTLKTPLPIAEFGEGSMHVYGMPPYQTYDRFRLLPDSGYIIARPDSSAIFIRNKNHELYRRISLDVKARPVKDADLGHQLELLNVDKRIRKMMIDRVPEEKPPFLNVWVSKNHILLHTDTFEEEGKQMVILTMEGEPVGTFYLSVYDEIKYLKDGRLYTLHKNPKVGHSVRIYQIVDNIN